MTTVINNLNNFMSSTVTRTITRSPGEPTTTAFTRELSNGSTITGGAKINKNGDGIVTVDVNRTGPNGNTKNWNKTFTPQFVTQPIVPPTVYYAKTDIQA